jgi:hypothetical protein
MGSLPQVLARGGLAQLPVGWVAGMVGVGLRRGQSMRESELARNEAGVS